MSDKITSGGIASKTFNVSLSKTTKPICDKLASLYPGVTYSIASQSGEESKS